MKNTVLLCTDLDRTLLPNGTAPESPGARDAFRTLSEHPSLALAYVTGRHLELVEQAITEYSLPVPDYLITDVGTRIYHHENDTWKSMLQWQNLIQHDWQNYTHGALADLLGHISHVNLQEEEKQNEHKLSYYVSLDVNTSALLDQVEETLGTRKIKCSLVYSIDEAAATGLLDILPASANKLTAIRFLTEQEQILHENTVFAGDSGNDLLVLCSDINSVLVANASNELRQKATDMSLKAGTLEQLYCARGGFLGMNGNYSAGILEGLIHFRPEIKDWL